MNAYFKFNGVQAKFDKKKIQNKWNNISNLCLSIYREGKRTGTGEGEITLSDEKVNSDGVTYATASDGEQWVFVGFADTGKRFFVPTAMMESRKSWLKWNLYERIIRLIQKEKPSQVTCGFELG